MTITNMTIKAATITATLALVASFACAAPAVAQDLGPNVRKLAEGVYAFVGENYNSNAGIVLTQDGVPTLTAEQIVTNSDANIERIKQGLKLTPEQEKHWNAFNSAMHYLGHNGAERLNLRVARAKRDPPDDETLLAHIIGPSGKLRAPVIRRGSTLLIGFAEDEFAKVLGGK